MKRLSFFAVSAALTYAPIILNAETSYSDYASVIDNAKVTGKYLGALDACDSFINNSGSLSIAAKTVANSIVEVRKESEESVRKSVLSSLESVDTDFNLIASIDAEMQSSRDGNVDIYYQALVTLTSDDAVMKDYDNVMNAASFCLTIMGAADPMVMNINLAGVEADKVLNDAAEVMQKYRDLAPVKN